MGDAGPPTPVPVSDDDQFESRPPTTDSHVRDIHVLVTGFGPFKTFAINPSWLIASALSEVLETEQPSEPVHSPNRPLRSANRRPYRIHVHTHPSSIRVSYSTVASTIPTLLSPVHNPTGIDYDYVLHIGLASGRSSYTLETIAHRDFYKIKDVDDKDGFPVGEFPWKKEGVPEKIEVGWDAEDVLRRWERTVEQEEEEHQNAILAHWENIQSQRGLTGTKVGEPSPSVQLEFSQPQQAPTEKAAVVKLSRDAGRFLCEFIFMASLTERWRDARKSTPSNFSESPKEKLGKAAFLHVPNGISVADVARGKRVAEAAIRAFVASWEDGYRNPRVYQPLEEPIWDIQNPRTSKVVLTVSAGSYEAKATGDA